MLESIIPILTLTIEVSGVAVILLGVLYGAWRFGRDLIGNRQDAYGNLRNCLGRSILLGLELLVAGDIINTVAVEPTLEKVLVLGGIVLIRTFLSFSLEVELDGTLPWKKREGKSEGIVRSPARS